VIVRHTAEAAEERLSRVLRASPSLTAWIADGVLARGEADLVGLSKPAGSTPPQPPPSKGGRSVSLAPVYKRVAVQAKFPICVPLDG
jgi:hypothetical protein